MAVRIDRPCDGVAVVVLDRPERMNAVDVEMYTALPEVFCELAGDPGVHAVVLTGAGRAFCAGADLEHHGATATDAPALETLMRKIHRGPLALYELPQPTIAAINGAAIGGGLGLALCCDIRIASPSAMFGTGFVRIGLGPDGGTSALLPRAVGVAAATELLLTAREVDGDEAQRLGLVSRVADDALSASVELASVLAALPADALRATKQTLRKALELDVLTVISDLEPRAQGVALARMFATASLRT